jgi:hypothetical protein
MARGAAAALEAVAVVAPREWAPVTVWGLVLGLVAVWMWVLVWILVLRPLELMNGLVLAQTQSPMLVLVLVLAPARRRLPSRVLSRVLVLAVALRVVRMSLWL